MKKPQLWIWRFLGGICALLLPLSEALSCEVLIAAYGDAYPRCSGMNTSIRKRTVFRRFACASAIGMLHLRGADFGKRLALPKRTHRWRSGKRPQFKMLQETSWCLLLANSSRFSGGLAARRFLRP